MHSFVMKPFRRALEGRFAAISALLALSALTSGVVTGAWAQEPPSTSPPPGEGPPAVQEAPEWQKQTPTVPANPVSLDIRTVVARAYPDKYNGNPLLVPIQPNGIEPGVAGAGAQALRG